MTQNLIAASEHADMAGWTDMYDAAPAFLKTLHNLAAIASNGAFILTSTGLPLGRFNSMIGLGIGTPATEAQIDDAIESFRRARATKYIIHVVPGALPHRR